MNIFSQSYMVIYLEKIINEISHGPAYFPLYHVYTILQKPDEFHPPLSDRNQVAVSKDQHGSSINGAYVPFMTLPRADCQLCL